MTQKVELVPGKKVTVRNDSKKYVAAVINYINNSCSLSVPEAPVEAFSPGDELTIEFPQWEDALYVLQAVVKKSLERQGSSLLLRCRVTGSTRVQRRKSERMAVRLSAEFSPLPEKKYSGQMLKGLVLNLSQTGALLSSEKPLSVGSELFLVFEMSIFSEKVSVGAKGKVVREHKEDVDSSFPYSYGIKFKNPERVLAG